MFSLNAEGIVTKLVNFSWEFKGAIGNFNSFTFNENFVSSDRLSWLSSLCSHLSELVVKLHAFFNRDPTSKIRGPPGAN
jgi:hypothetical protein